MRNAWLLLLFGLAGCRLAGDPRAVEAPADVEAGEIAFDLLPGDAAILVPVHINGHGPFDLVLDTGATFTCVSTALAEQLALPEQRRVIGIGAGVHQAGRVRIIRFDSVRVGAAAVHDMPGCVLDLAALEAIGAPIDGLLGLNFMRAFDVRLDFERGIVAFTQPGPATAPADAAQ